MPLQAHPRPLPQAGGEEVGPQQNTLSYIFPLCQRGAGSLTGWITAAAVADGRGAMALARRVS